MKNKVTRIILAGGEPTCYTNFATLLERAKENSIKVQLTTNGLYDEEVARWVAGDFIEEAIFHAVPHTLATFGDGDGVFTENLMLAREKGVEVFVRVTFDLTEDFDRWLDAVTLCESVGVSCLHYGIAFENFDGGNTFYNFKGGVVDPAFTEKLRTLYNECTSKGISLHQCKPSPLCALDGETFSTLANGGALRTSCMIANRGYTNNLTINPDLSTFPCNAIPITGEGLRERANFGAFTEANNEYLKGLLDGPIFPECEECLLHHMRLCTGGCLATRASGDTLEDF